MLTFKRVPLPLLSIGDHGTGPDSISPKEIVDPPYPGIGKDQTLLDGYVGWIRCSGKGGSTPNEGLVVMHSVATSDSLPGLAMTSGVEDYVLVHVQGFVGKMDSVFLGHGRS